MASFSLSSAWLIASFHKNLDPDLTHNKSNFFSSRQALSCVKPILNSKDAPSSFAINRSFFGGLLETKASVLWLDFKNCFLKQKGDNPLCRYWLEPIIPSKVEKNGSNVLLTLHAPSDLHKKWLQENLMEDIYKYLRLFYKGISQIHLEVTPKLSLPRVPFPSGAPFAHPQKVLFHPGYMFENFIVGKANHLAYSASLSVSQCKKSEIEFNPLFIYGPSGLGKTHLLNAIGQQALKNQPQARVLYLSAERFLNEYIRALQNKQMASFRKKFRKSCDLLLMDDIQIIAKGKGIQEEFFHTFNELYNQKAQIVVCCDQPPGSVPFLEERVKTRLEGGLMVDISYPDKETRLAILKNKTEQKGLFLSQQSMARIAQTCRQSIREIEGVLNKIKIMTELHGGGLSLKEIDKILSGLQKELTVEEIQKKTAKAFGLSLEELKSPSRKKPIVTGRQAAMYLIRNTLKKPLSDIGLAFGKKDHTTVLNSIKRVEKLRATNKDFKRTLEDLHNSFHNDY